MPRKKTIKPENVKKITKIGEHFLRFENKIEALPIADVMDYVYLFLTTHKVKRAQIQKYCKIETRAKIQQAIMFTHHVREDRQLLLAGRKRSRINHEIVEEEIRNRLESDSGWTYDDL